MNRWIGLGQIYVCQIRLGFRCLIGVLELWWKFRYIDDDQVLDVA
jgi:hypothetical protein